MCLNTLVFPVSGTVWEGLDAALLKEIYHWGTFEVLSPAVRTSCLLFMVQDVSSHLFLLQCLHSTIPMDPNHLGLEAPLNTLFYELPWSRYFVTATET